MILMGGYTVDLDAANRIRDRAPVGSIYDTAYTVTNEDMRYEVAQTPNAQDVLTIAGSGDQALFYKLGGAKNVDTFDITIGAAAIQEIKFAALKMNIPYMEYVKMLQDLHNAKDVTSVKYMPEILTRIAPSAAYYVRGVKHTWPFGNGLSADPASKTMITPAEYQQLQSMQLKAPLFIWENALKIGKCLTKKYDVINLSNIFDRSPDLIQKTIPELAQHLKKGGKIIAEFAFCKAADNFMDVAASEPMKSLGEATIMQKERLLVFQRTR